MTLAWRDAALWESFGGSLTGPAPWHPRLSTSGAWLQRGQRATDTARLGALPCRSQEPEQYCSQRTAVDMAVAAYRRAAQLTSFGTHVLGVGATCALATVSAARAVPGG